MKKYEYKTEFIPLPVEKIQDAISEFGSVGWRTVQASPVEGGSIVILEREIEADNADTNVNKPGSEESEYDVIPADGHCYISIAGMPDKDCFFCYKDCPVWALRRCEKDGVIFVKKGGVK